MDRNIPEYFYTVDLGSHFGPKLERLAEWRCCDDREELAAILLQHAIEQAEMRMKADLFDALEPELHVQLFGEEFGGDIDDEILF